MTIKECAAALGLTKAGVRYWMNRINEPLHKDDTGRVSISAEVFQRLQRAMKPESTVESDPESEVESGNEQTGKQAESKRKVEREPESRPENTVESGAESEKQVESAESVALDVLRKLCQEREREIERLNAKLDEKEHRIDELTDRLNDALVKAQALHMGNLLQGAEGADEASTVPEDHQHESEKEPPKRRRWLFGWGKKRG